MKWAVLQQRRWRLRCGGTVTADARKTSYRGCKVACLKKLFENKGITTISITDSLPSGGPKEGTLPSTGTVPYLLERSATKDCDTMIKLLILLTT
jgi:hypothetical protein